jgi:hypothetical protein
MVCPWEDHTNSVPMLTLCLERSSSPVLIGKFFIFCGLWITHLLLTQGFPQSHGQAEKGTEQASLRESQPS